MPKTEVAKAEMMVRIDGSFGEGGGQILRSSLSLSLVTGRPFRIENIRANRQKPGLLRQHLTAVQAAAEVGSAEVEGASLGSKALTFVPGEIRAGDFRFAIGTAGSGTLVLQTILPALITAAGPSRVEIEGGTHNPAAPPFDFLQRSFIPLIESMGPKVKLELQRYGFYPAGGGRFLVEITPTDVLKPIGLEERGEITTRRATALVANLPYHIAKRELDTVGKLLNWDAELLRCEDTKNSVSPGNLVTIELASSNVTQIFTAFGKLGVSAEDVAKDAAEQAHAYMHSTAVVDEHLADQLLLPIALAGGGSIYRDELQHARKDEHGSNPRVLAGALRGGRSTRAQSRFSSARVRVNRREWTRLFDRFGIWSTRDLLDTGRTMLTLGAPEDAIWRIFLLQKTRSHGMLGHLLTKGRPNWWFLKTNR